ncbi:response regulator [Alteromonadaceae bacterium M269]|nr:response regulator [Alteromonadaceae bacterium M269]
MDKPIILVVDDTPENIDVLSGVLRNEYKVKAALNGEKALQIANKSPQPSMILLDIMMPGMDGYQVCAHLKENPLTAKIPVIFVTAKDQDNDEKKGLELGAADYITKPITPSLVLARVSTHLALYDQNLALEKKVQERTKELRDAQLKIIHRLGRAAEFKDNETGLHVTRMSHYARLIAGSLSLGKEREELIFNAAPMHDIGKIGIPDNVLLKNGKLNEEEWNLMKNHPQFGADIIGDHDSELLKVCQMIALTHHEKWDGSGYPNQLKGEEIPIEGRIVAVADVFDALTTERAYKKAWSVDDAINLIDENAGSHFDPNVVAHFHQVLPDILDIKRTYAESTG